MKLGKVFSECELTEFFGSAPELDDTPDEREFFARNTFTVDSGDVRLELSLDPYTPQVTIELFAANKILLNSTMTLRSGSIENAGDSRTLCLETINGSSVFINLPQLNLRIVNESPTGRSREVRRDTI